MKKTRVMTFGTFDGLHPGHLNMLQQARKLSKDSFLIVAIARDINVKRLKGKKPDFSERKRLLLLKKCRLANKVILASRTNYLTLILKEKPEIIALGYDQKAYVQELKRDLKKKKIKTKIVRLKPYKQDIYKNSLLRISKAQGNK